MSSIELYSENVIHQSTKWVIYIYVPGKTCSKSKRIIEINVGEIWLFSLSRRSNRQLQ